MSLRVYDYTVCTVQYLTSCTMGTVSFPGVKCGRGVLLTTHSFLCHGHGRVELYPPSGPHRACKGITLPFTMRNNRDGAEFCVKYHLYWKIKKNIQRRQIWRRARSKRTPAVTSFPVIWSDFWRRLQAGVNAYLNMGQDKTLLPVAAQCMYKVRTLLIFQ